MDSHAAAGLSPCEIQYLRDVAGTMLPADAAFGVPGADDPAILDDIVASVGRDLPMVRAALAAIAERAGTERAGTERAGAERASDTFASLDRDRREALVAGWYTKGGTAAGALGRVILGAYYRDDRVLRSLGQEGRTPFPKGYTLEQGDWSLIEAVRHRPLLWRDDRKELAK
ncbi:hypothetical protein BH11PSE3_BH11PSE3_34940 [soil metagenome]